MNFSNKEKNKIKNLCSEDNYKIDYCYFPVGRHNGPNIKIYLIQNNKIYFNVKIVIINGLYRYDFKYTDECENTKTPNLSDNFNTVYNEFEKWINNINKDYNLSIIEDEYISKISPRFYSIYKQAEQSKNLNHTEICGAGYRKAFEVLIKDYIIYINPTDNKNKIKKGLLPTDKNNKNFGELLKLIKHYFSNDKTIITACTSCAYLGNDHSHYETTKINDIDDLISAINTLLDYIKMVYKQEKEKTDIEQNIEKINKNIKDK